MIFTFFTCNPRHVGVYFLHIRSHGAKLKGREFCSLWKHCEQDGEENFNVVFANCNSQTLLILPSVKMWYFTCVKKRCVLKLQRRVMLQFPTVVQRHQEILTEHTEVSFGLGTIKNSLVTQPLTINTFFQLTDKHSQLTMNGIHVYKRRWMNQGCVTLLTVAHPLDKILEGLC